MSVEPRTCPAYPFGEAVKLDLYPEYAVLQRDEPVARVRLPYGGRDGEPAEAWLVTGYAEVKQVLVDPRFSGDAATAPETPRVTPWPLRRGMMLTMDPPEHTRLRRLVAKEFTMRRVDQLRPDTERIVTGLFDDLVAHGSPADFVEHVALPLPITVISHLLGVPAEDEHHFRAFTEVMGATTKYTAAQVNQARDQLEDYLRALIERRRTEPSDDLLGALVLARDEGDRLSEEELVRVGVNLLIAGYETTASQLANFTYVLLHRPELFAQLRDDPDLVPSAVEELLRTTPLRTSGSFPRVATEDVRLGEVLVRAGETVLIQLAVANRDPKVFTDPDEVKLDREHNPHLGFGHGVHHCLGALLAKMELRLVLRQLAERFPDLRLAVPAEAIPWKAGLLARGPLSLPIAW
ncbi:cytochrome P450 [Crossiella sp. SN42]|uniref:cytochrome P450 n=1 Tax=Crossiella sp. SN42 TaxID=2944808 RepID=UPI00207D0BD2|nr:cytochrome P450 [Crossiella sp. SN42]MCO1581934.1 cytochrome P450 [Crossiella sp. SN42]